MLFFKAEHLRPADVVLMCRRAVLKHHIYASCMKLLFKACAHKLGRCAGKQALLCCVAAYSEGYAVVALR